MKIQFYPAATGDPQQLADALVIFEEAGLWGVSLAGISLWSNGRAPGGIAVSLPGRTYEAAGGDERRYSFIRGDKRIVQRLKDTIRAEYRRQHPEAARSGQQPVSPGALPAGGPSGERGSSGRP